MTVRIELELSDEQLTEIAERIRAQVRVYPCRCYYGAAITDDGRCTRCYGIPGRLDKRERTVRLDFELSKEQPNELAKRLVPRLAPLLDGREPRDGEDCSLNVEQAMAYLADTAERDRDQVRDDRAELLREALHTPTLSFACSTAHRGKPTMSRRLRMAEDGAA